MDLCQKVRRNKIGYCSVLFIGISDIKILIELVISVKKARSQKSCFPVPPIPHHSPRAPPLLQHLLRKTRDKSHLHHRFRASSKVKNNLSHVDPTLRKKKSPCRAIIIGPPLFSPYRRGSNGPGRQGRCDQHERPAVGVALARQQSSGKSPASIHQYTHT